MDRSATKGGSNYCIVLLLGSIFVSTILCLLYVHSLSSLGSKQKLETVESTLSNLYIKEKEHYLKAINYEKMKVTCDFFMSTWSGIMAADLYIDQ